MGTRVDVRDVDYIWSPATVVRSYKKSVTVRFDGWGKEVDETVEWNDGNRIAPLYSFTKCVKCLVDLLPKQKGKPSEEEMQGLPDNAQHTYSNLWPCKVQFRMPHPVQEGADDEEDCWDAQAFLAGEETIFVQPYEPHKLPLSVQHKYLKHKEHGGTWIPAKLRIKPWKENPLELGVLPQHFETTFRLAQLDKETPGVLPPNAIDEGSLLKEEYLVHSREGAKVRDGSLQKEEVDEEEVDEEEEDVATNNGEAELEEYDGGAYAAEEERTGSTYFCVIS